jgi:hypothetical protein
MSVLEQQSFVQVVPALQQLIFSLLQQSFLQVAPSFTQVEPSLVQHSFVQVAPSLQQLILVESITVVAFLSY